MWKRNLVNSIFYFTYRVLMKMPISNQHIKKYPHDFINWGCKIYHLQVHEIMLHFMVSLYLWWLALKMWKNMSSSISEIILFRLRRIPAVFLFLSKWVCLRKKGHDFTILVFANDKKQNYYFSQDSNEPTWGWPVLWVLGITFFFLVFQLFNN